MFPKRLENITTEGGKKLESLNGCGYKEDNAGDFNEYRIDFTKTYYWGFFYCQNFIVPLKTILPLSNMIGIFKKKAGNL